MRFDLNPDGWICWPEREDLSLEFMRLLAAAQEGGSTVSECWLTASRVDFTDDDSWYREWSKTADANNDRGFAAFAKGNLVTARRNWLRALNYYSAAAYPFDLAPDKQRAAVLMHKYEEMEYSQIAGALGCSESAVKSLLFRAYESLRTRLAHLS